MTLALVVIAQLLAAVSAYYVGRIRGLAQGRCDGFAQGHERAMEVSSSAIQDGVFRLAERVTSDFGGRYSPTLHRFLVEFVKGEHLK